MSSLLSSLYCNSYSKLILNCIIPINSSTAYYPQTDRQTECINQEVEQFLHLFTNHCQTDWSDWLVNVEFAYNNHEQTSTSMSPFFINYRRHLFVRNNLWHQPTNKSAGQFTKCIKEIIKQVAEHLNIAAKQIKQFYNS